MLYGTFFIAVLCNTVPIAVMMIVVVLAVVVLKVVAPKIVKYK
jgi:hypothetical protein